MPSISLIRLAFASILLWIPSTSPAQESADDPILTHYVETYGVTASEARRRLEYVEKAADLQSRLSAQERIRFAGLYIEHEPSFRVVVRLVGAADQLLRRYTDDPTFVAEKASVPLVAIRNKQEAVIRALSRQQNSLSTDIDVRTGRLKIYVPDPESAQSIIRSAGVSEGEADFVRVTQRERVSAMIQGGEVLNGPLESNGTREGATTGFVVTNGSLRGVVTAGHFGECAGMPTSCTKNAPATHASGVTLNWQTQQNQGSNDWEWRAPSGSHSLPNSIRYGRGAYTMPITAVRDATAFPVGTVVCKEGRTSGYTCGTIESAWSQVTYNGQVGFYVRVKHSGSGTMSQAGDSGGPVFGSNTAYGIVHSGITQPADQYGHMHFMSITRIEGVGLRVVTQ